MNLSPEKGTVIYLVPNQSVSHLNPQLPCSNLALRALNVITLDCVDFY